MTASSSRTALSLRLFYFMHFGAMGAYLPYFPSWLQAQGIEGFRMSVIVALLPALSIVAPSGFGLLADALGLRGSILRLASLGALLSMLALAWRSSDTAGAQFWSFFTCIVCFGFFRTPLQLLADVVALEQPSDYARVRMWGSIGFMLVAPVIGHWLAFDRAWLLPMSVAGLLSLTFFASFGLPKRSGLPPTPVLTEVKRLVGQRGYLAFLAATLLGQGAHIAYELCISLRLRELGVTGGLIGLAWTLGTLAEVALMACSITLFRRFSPVALLAFSLLVSALRWLFLSQVSSFGWLLAFQPLHAITFGLRWVASMALVRHFATERTLATSQGLFLTATAIGQAIGMLAWGTLYAKIGAGVFLYSALVSMLALGATLWLSGTKPGPASALVSGSVRAG